MRQLELGLPKTPGTKMDFWDKLKKLGQTDEELLEEMRGSEIIFDSQLIVKRMLEIRGTKYNPRAHANTDLDWGVHYA